ncbi:hypothetical protein Tco_0579082 [Tanacetum coccineum]
MSTLNQQTLADSGANERPPMLDKGNYIPWESRFRRFLDNKLEEGDRMWRLIKKVPYKRPMIANPDNTTEQILEPLSKMTEGIKKQYIADVKVMNYLLQATPNDIYNLVDTCKNAKDMWERIKRLMFGSDVTTSKARKDAKNHHPLALLAHSNASSSQSHANSSYSPQPYYVTHPSSVVDYDDEYQGELQGDSQEDKLTTAMMLLAQAITQKFSTPTNNRLRTSSNTRNQAVIQDGRVDIQTKNAGYGGNGNRNSRRQNRNQAFNAGNGNDDTNQIVQCVPRTKSTLRKANFQCYICNEKGHYARDYEASSNLKDEENDFMLDNSYGDDTLEELTAVVIMMARIQPVDDNANSESSYDAKAVSEVNASNKIHEPVKHKTIIHTSNDDQIDYNIIFDDPYVENNSGTSEHDLNAHDEYHNIQMLAYNVQREAENKKRLNNELKKQKELLQKEPDTFKDRLVKKDFKERENLYLDDIVDLEEKLSSNDRIVYKMGQSIQTIHMLGKEPNKVYVPFLKAGLGYKNLKGLKKAIAAQPKIYHDDMLRSTNLKIDSPDSEETLEDAKESRLKMRNKMVQPDYGKLNALYETFVPQQEPSTEQTYLSIPSTSNHSSETKETTSDLPIQKMPNESKLLKMLDKMSLAIYDLRKRIDVTLLEDKERRWMSDNQNSLREFYKTDVILMSDSLSINLNELQQELIEETISELKNKIKTIEKGKNVNTKFDKSKTSGSLLCVTPLPKNIAVKANKVTNTNINIDRLKPVTSYSIPINEQSQKQSVESSNSVRRPQSKDTKSKDRLLKNTNDKRSSAHVWKMSSSDSIDSNKHETMNSICVAHYALSRDSKVKRALFTTPVAAKSKNLGSTYVVAKSRLSVAKIPTATNKVSSALPLSSDSSQSRMMRKLF